MPGPRFAASKFRGPPAAEWSVCVGGADRALGWTPHTGGVFSGGGWADPAGYAQIRRIPHTKGGGMGIYATEDIWHGQEVMLVNQEQPSNPDDTS